jgi:hypothetical protein
VPDYNDDDKAALAALLTRFTTLWRQRYWDEKKLEEAQARLATYPEQIEKMRAAFSIFGVAGLMDENWKQLRKDLGDEIYFGALRKVAVPNPFQPAPVLPEKPIELPLSSDDAGAATESEKDATVRELVLARLQQSGSSGDKAADIRAHIEKVRGTTLHEKTVGMYLYRLSQEGAARREGRTWFFVAPVEQTKNPGAEDAGATNRDTKEGEEL